MNKEQETKIRVIMKELGDYIHREGKYKDTDVLPFDRGGKKWRE